MVLVLNYAHIILLLTLAVYVTFVATSKAKNKSKQIVLATVFTLLALIAWRAAQPSYLPKGSISRTELPEFTPAKGEVVDKQSKPVPGSERDKKRAEQLKEPLPFIKESK